MGETIFLIILIITITGFLGYLIYDLMHFEPDK